MNQLNIKKSEVKLGQLTSNEQTVSYLNWIELNWTETETYGIITFTWPYKQCWEAIMETEKVTN